MSNVALLVIDVQTALINEHPYNGQKTIDNISKLISAARDSEKEVIYIRHDGGKGDELEYGCDGWQIYNKIAPNSSDKIFDKHYNSAFLETRLKEYLDYKKIDTLILVGLQTEYCMDTTCKIAFELGYKVIIAEETNTTYDNEYLTGKKLYEFYNYKIWNKRFADVLSVKKVIKILKY